MEKLHNISIEKHSPIRLPFGDEPSSIGIGFAKPTGSSMGCVYTL